MDGSDRPSARNAFAAADLAVLEEREEEVLGRDVVVLEGRGGLLGEVEELYEGGGEARLGVLARDVRELCDELRDLLRRVAGRDADAFEERRHDATLLCRGGPRPGAQA